MRKIIFVCLMVLNSSAFADSIHFECTGAGPAVYKIDGDNAQTPSKGSAMVSGIKNPCGIMAVGKNTNTYSVQCLAGKQLKQFLIMHGKKLQIVESDFSTGTPRITNDEEGSCTIKK